MESEVSGVKSVESESEVESFLVESESELFGVEL